MSNDMMAIVNVVNLYAVAVDTHRYELFDKVFTADVKSDFGAAAWTDLESIKRDFAAIHAPFDATQHAVSGHTIAVDGDQAHCLSYVHARFLRSASEGSGLFDSTGWYDDRLVRTPQGWRIAERASRMLSASGDAGVMQAMPDVDTDFQLLSLSGEAAAGRLKFMAHADKVNS